MDRNSSYTSGPARRASVRHTAVEVTEARNAPSAATRDETVPDARLVSMSEVTRILVAIESGDPHAAEQLLPLVHSELRKLAAQKLVQERSGQTLQATALVHEAYIRLVGGDQS